MRNYSLQIPWLAAYSRVFSQGGTVVAGKIYRRFLLGLLWLPVLANGYMHDHLPEEVVIGVLAVRPLVQEQQGWAALEDYLTLRLSAEHTDELRVRVRPLPYAELDGAVLRREVDFVLTQPAHYILLARRYGLSAPLATLLREQRGEVMSAFGGVILVRADDERIHTLRDIIDKRIASVSTHSFGAWMMQIYELREAGLRMPPKEQWHINAISHDLAVEALLANDVDVAFVRSGILEAMSVEGKLDPTHVRVIHPQPFSHFPFLVSTRLYPEWSFSSMSHVGNRLNNIMAAALLTMPLGGEVARQSDIHGFSTAMSYESVEALLRDLRQPPFDSLPHFTAEDVWYQYQLPISLVLAMGLLILILLLLLLVSRFRLKHSQEDLRERVKEAETLRDIMQLLSRYEWPLRETLQACVNRIPAGWLHPEKTSARIRIGDIEVCSEGFVEEGISQQASIPLPDGGIGQVVVFLQLSTDGHFLAEEEQLLQTIAAQLAQSLQHYHDQAMLEASEERNRAMVSAIPDILFRHDKDGRFLDFQAVDYTQLLLPPDAFIGHTINEVMPTDLAAQAMGMLADTLATGEVGQMEYELNLPTGQGYFELRMSRINDREVLAIARDVTARKRIEQELKRSNEELEQFAYAVSHDMRQPLRMISGHLQILERSLAATLDAEQRESMNFARNGAIRMDSMIVSLLEYSRVGRKTEPMARIASRDALDEALRFLKPHTDETGAIIVMDGEWPEVYASRDELSRLLQNLIGNGVKYHADGVIPSLQLHSVVMSQSWRVEICDNGIGIDPAQHGRLFKVFSRLNARSQYEGSGVGLALCRKIVEHHAGVIGVESAGEGMGSCFWFELPLKGNV